MFAIEHIIFQYFQFLQIEVGVLLCLVEAVYDTVADIQAVEHIGIKLVRFQILFFCFQTEVTPDYILSCELAGTAKVFFGQLKAGEMVTVHYKNGILAALLKHFY